MEGAWRELGRIRAGGGREARGQGAACGSHQGRGWEKSEERFLVPFKTIKNPNQRMLTIRHFNWNQTLSSVKTVVRGIFVLFCRHGIRATSVMGIIKRARGRRQPKKRYRRHRVPPPTCTHTLFERLLGFATLMTADLKQ